MSKLSNMCRGGFLCLIFIGIFGPATQASDAKKELEFRKAAPGYFWQFPRDHGSHPEYQTEWWYFTGHLHEKTGDKTGRLFGFQWTVFRTALQHPNTLSPEASPWRTRNLYLGHMALSDLQEKKFYYTEALSRDSLQMAGSSTQAFKVWMDRFSGNSRGDSWEILAQGEAIQLKLRLELPQEPVLQGQQGYSPKAKQAGHASHYYTYPKMPAQGAIEIGGQEYQVTGQAWMDHEFGSNQLTQTQVGWDWFGLPLQDKQALMVYRLRDERGEKHHYLSGTYVDQTGQAHSLRGEDIVLIPGSRYRSKKSKGVYPIDWQIKVPRFGVDLKVDANFAEQELVTEQSTQVTYWEGSMSVQGQAEGQEIQSLGYCEMTGYAEKFKQDI